MIVVRLVLAPWALHNTLHAPTERMKQPSPHLNVFLSTCIAEQSTNTGGTSKV